MKNLLKYVTMPCFVLIKAKKKLKFKIWLKKQNSFHSGRICFLKAEIRIIKIWIDIYFYEKQEEL